MTTRRADVVIIGAGSSGLSAAYELAKAGVDVVVVERGFLAKEASGRNPGGIRQIGRDEDELPLMTAAMQLWHSLEEELDCDLELRDDGYLWAALSQEDLDVQRALKKRDDAFGIEEYVLDRNEVAALAPAVSDFVCGGLYSPTDLIANPFLVAKGYHDAAQREGAQFLFGTEVVGIRTEGNRVQSVLTSHGEIASELVINAAGPWASLIGEMAGVELPITPCPNQFILTESMPPILPPFLLISGIAVCRQSERGNVYIGNTNAPGGITGYSKATNHGEMVRTVKNILKIVPEFRGLNIIRTWVGTIAFSPDDNFIFGPTAQVEGLILACGFSGHGFALTPIIGQLLCEQVVDGRTSLPTRPFHLSRFNRGQTAKARHFAHQHLEAD